jgi:DNA-binding CsgD family transcriptional regulator
MLVERSRELAVLDGLLGKLRDGASGVVVIEGAAGIGKSTLLDWAVGEAAGLQVLRARGEELEHDLAFGAVREALMPRLLELGEDERAELLRGPAALAAPTLGLDGDRGTDGLGDPLYGLYWLLVSLAERAPVLLAVDDLHWLDIESARLLDYLARRLDGVALLMVVTTRAGEPGEHVAIREALTERATVLRPDVLSEEGVAALLDGAQPELVSACHEATGGNPLLVRELARELPDSADPALVRSLGPRSIARSVVARARRLSDDAVVLARAVSVFPAGARLADAAALTDLDAARAASAADGLVSCDVLTAHDTLRFVHPLLRNSVYEDIPPLERRRLHSNAALMLRDRAEPPERVAAHLLSCEPAGAQWVVETLEAAADAAMRAAAPRAASRYLERALTEPPGDRARLSRRLGEVQMLTDARAAEPHLVYAVENGAGPTERADAAVDLARLRLWDERPDEAVEALLPFVGLDLASRETALLLQGLLGLAAESSDHHNEVWRTQVLPRDLAGETPGERLVLALLAVRMEGESAPRDDIVATVARTIDPATGTVDDTNMGLDLSMSVLCGCHAWDLLEQCAKAQVSRARQRGDASTYHVALGWLSKKASETGPLPEAAEFGELAIESATAPGHRWATAWTLSRIAAYRGRWEDAHHWLGVMNELDKPGSTTDLVFRQIRTIDVACLQGDVKAAGAAADAILELRAAAPSAQQRAVSAAGYGLAASGRADEARSVVEEPLERARRSGHVGWVAIYEHVLGLASRGDEAVEHLAAAVAGLEQSGQHVRQAWAHVDYGAAIRRSGQRRAAREQLTPALELAQRVGADACATRALDELRAAGARPRRELRVGVDALTPSERRIAELAATGLTNREIAQHLFLTMKTVESHLGSIYRKLDIGSRRALPDALR